MSAREARPAMPDFQLADLLKSSRIEGELKLEIFFLKFSISVKMTPLQTWSRSDVLITRLSQSFLVVCFRPDDSGAKETFGRTA